MDINNYTHS